MASPKFDRRLNRKKLKNTRGMGGGGNLISNLFLFIRRSNLGKAPNKNKKRNHKSEYAERKRTNILIVWLLHQTTLENDKYTNMVLNRELNTKVTTKCLNYLLPEGSSCRNDESEYALYLLFFEWPPPNLTAE